MTTAAWTQITTADQLGDLLGAPTERAVNKGRAALVDVEPSGMTIEELDDYYGPGYARRLYR